MEIIGNGHLANTVKEGLKEVGVEGNYTIIAIDTPINDDYSVDITEIEKAVDRQKDNDSLVIVMSPVPVGTCRKLQMILGRELVYNPENLRTNFGTEYYLRADRQIIGCSKELQWKMFDFYAWFTKSLNFMSLEEAEMVKHCTNGFLANSITLANQFKELSDKVGADYEKVMEGMKSDRRIGQNAYLTPGEPSKHLKRDVKILNSI